jgi:hypothetical protein
MAPRTDDPTGPDADGSLLELPWLRVPASVGASRRMYFDLARRCLYDEAFATEIVAAQDAVVARVSDASAWWRHVIACYDDWAQWTRA